MQVCFHSRSDGDKRFLLQFEQQIGCEVYDGTMCSDDAVPAHKIDEPIKVLHHTSASDFGTWTPCNWDADIAWVTIPRAYFPSLPRASAAASALGMALLRCSCRRSFAETIR